MSITRHHNDWLRLVPSSGPFLSLPVLAEAFPQGLEVHDVEHARRLRLAFEEWEESQAGRRSDPAVHRAWILFVLEETLGHTPFLATGQQIPQALCSEVAEQGETLRPDWIVNDPETHKPRLLLQVYPRTQSLTRPVAGRRWNASPDGRMMQLLHDTGVRLGLVTNGEHWMLVNAPRQETTGYASWHASLWLEEPVTLRAFRTLLGADRLFRVSPDQTLEALLDASTKDQRDVTDQLGHQVRRAVELLILSLDKADRERDRTLLAKVDERTLYESALTVMMRLVFLFCAEERGLLLLGDELYDKNYAVSTLREQLRVTADQFGEETLGLRHDAWARLLTTFRAVYAGARHDRLRLPAYGGSLFDPDRFPFLEGRPFGTTWKSTEAVPLPVSNRTVLHLLEALQVLQMKAGKGIEARPLSFRALDIEQIGHVYEGLLDHTARRASEPMLGLAGTQDKEPELPLWQLEQTAARGEAELLRFLQQETGRKESSLKKSLLAQPDDQFLGRLRTVCEDADLWARVRPFAGLLRLDDVDYPMVLNAGSLYVTTGSDRRSTGTHYTPRSLTEPIVQYTLEPLVYVGPAEGRPKAEWTLKPAKELLDLKICDLACGSGAFLVQAARYLADRLLEAWEQVRVAHPHFPGITPEGLPSTGQVDEDLIPDDAVERKTFAMRIIAQRCLYGVDKNPLAAEMAKLSLWLLTLAKDKPFEFLDHAIRIGDSLLGIHDPRQLQRFHLAAGTGSELEVAAVVLTDMGRYIAQAAALRRQLMELQSRTLDDVDAQDRLLHAAREQTERLRCAADLLVAAEFVPGNATDRRAARDDAAVRTAFHFGAGDVGPFRAEAAASLRGQTPFHWALEFPEVLVERGGFDAVIGNPPFVGGQRLTGSLGEEYREFLVEQIAGGQRGSADLSAYFFLKAVRLLRANGMFGLVATNTISQGDTREVGLDQLCRDGCTLPRAIASQPWPGVASLEVAYVWGRKGAWSGPYVLEDQPTHGISSFLTAPGAVTGTPYRLKANEGKSFQGSIVLGMGFVLTPEEAQQLIAKDPRNKEVLFPYLNGEDLNSRPDQSPSRWVINFFDWPIEKAMEYPDCFRIVEEKVKPERMRNTFSRNAKENWWLYERSRPELYRAIENMDRMTVFAQTSKTKYPALLFSPNIVFDQKTVVIALGDYLTFALLCSHIHHHWVLAYGSSLRTDAVYTPSDCFETFAFPITHSSVATNLENLGKLYHECRHQIMLSGREGLTRTYNRFHDSAETTASIHKLRNLHITMDQAVAAAYGWTDLDLGHGFHETKQGVRFTISEPARREVLQRLLKLNHERYAEEVRQGLHDKKKGGKKKPTKAAEPASTKKQSKKQGRLFGEDVP